MNTIKAAEEIRILVIEDNEGDFILIEDYLTEEFVNPYISHTSSLAETRALFKTGTKFDVILLDLNLPDAEGPELIQAALELAEGAPLIVLTGYADVEFGIKTISMGTSDYLLKDELNPSLLNKSITYNIERKRANARLVASEKKYRDLFQLSPLPMWVYEVDSYKFLNVNDAALKHYGYSHEEFLKMRLQDLYLPEDVPLLEKEVALVRENKKPGREGVFRHRKKGGELIWVELSSKLIDFNNLRAELVLCIDITSELEKEEKIEKANKRLENAEAIAGLGYWEHDLKSNTLYWSDEFYHILELNRNETAPAFQTFKNMLVPEEQGHFEKQYENACRQTGEVEFEHRIVCPSGQIKTLYSKGTLVTDAQNNPLRFESIVLDITKRKQEENLLRLQESVITNASDAVIITEAEPMEEPGPRIMFVNDALTNMTGYKKEEILGKSPRIFIGPDTSQRELAKLRIALRRLRSCEIEVINYKKNGKPFWVNISVAPVADKSGTITHWIAIERDVTERKNYVKTLEMHNARLRDIAWTQSHVVRAPLARIMGLTSIINRLYGNEITEKRLLSDLETSAKELDLIIRKIVRLAESANLNLKE